MTPRVRFRLATVLRLRKHREDACAFELARRVIERDVVDTRVARLTALAGNERATLIALAGGGVPGPALALAADVAAHAAAGARRESVRLADATARVDAARATLIGASRDRRVLDRLRDRARETAEREAITLEQRALDDTAGANARWRDSAGGTTA